MEQTPAQLFFRLAAYPEIHLFLHGSRVRLPLPSQVEGARGQGVAVAAGAPDRAGPGSGTGRLQFRQRTAVPVLNPGLLRSSSIPGHPVLALPTSFVSTPAPLRPSVH